MYDNNPQTISDLKAAITAAIRAIPREECGRVIENFARRIIENFASRNFARIENFVPFARRTLPAGGRNAGGSSKTLPAFYLNKTGDGVVIVCATT